MISFITHTRWSLYRDTRQSLHPARYWFKSLHSVYACRVFVPRSAVPAWWALSPARHQQRSRHPSETASEEVC